MKMRAIRGLAALAAVVCPLAGGGPAHAGAAGAYFVLQNLHKEKPAVAGFVVTFSVERHGKPADVAAQMARHEDPGPPAILYSGTIPAHGAVFRKHQALSYRKSVTVDEQGKVVSTTPGSVDEGLDIAFRALPAADGKVSLLIVGDVSYPADPAHPFKQISEKGGVIDLPDMVSATIHTGTEAPEAIGRSEIFTLSPELQLRVKVERAS